jgi:hypothetical protein
MAIPRFLLRRVLGKSAFSRLNQNTQVLATGGAMVSQL